MTGIPIKETCPKCQGTGKTAEEKACPRCGGSGELLLTMSFKKFVERVREALDGN